MSSSSPTSFAVNIDLSRERQLATIESEEFAEWWAGGRQALSQRRALEKLFFDDAEFDDHDGHIAYMSHKQLYEHSVVRATKMIAKLRVWQAQQEAEERKKGVTKTEIQSFYDFRMLLSGPLGTALFQQSNSLRLHFSMFLPTLLGQGTEEQQRQWLQKAWLTDGIIGTYAQTELGHGTHIRGLETRADYDASSDEFVLNTPTLTAYKWWPGGLGHTANYVIALAQLYVKDKPCGLQPFLVRIRNEETHMPEPGVDVGEIGAKLGTNGVNNGFLGFRNVRIPRTQMLMKNAQVTPDGRFVRGPEPLLTYGTMVFVRVMIVRDVSFNLLQAATIATRYSAVRRQSPIEQGQPEPQIFDHVTQQAKVLPQIAKGIFYRLAADFVWTLYQSVIKELEEGYRRNLPELHALSCCLKAYCSHESAAGIEILRRACGGHGYLTSANFQQIYGVATAACTYEGENTVMMLQTARFLIKTYMDGLKRKVLPKSVAYLRITTRPKWTKNKVELSEIVRALELASTEQTRIAFEYQRLKRKENNTTSDMVAGNLAGLKLIAAANAHGRAFLARTALEAVAQQSRQVRPALAEVFAQLAELFVLDIFLAALADVLRCVVVPATVVNAVEARYEVLLAALRRNAVAVVDGFDFHDRVLGSTLGSFDGRVYERLMEEARKSPLNQEPVNKTFQTHLRPFMQGKL